MELNALQDDFEVAKESSSLAARLALVVFCLAAGFAYRLIVGLLPANVIQMGVLLVLSLFFLGITVLARKKQRLIKYWEIPFAFFVFTIAGIAGDQAGFIQQTFVRTVLHEIPSVQNPLGSTVIGMVLAQLASTASLIIPILLLTTVSGHDLKSIFIAKPRNWWTLVVGLIGFLVYYRFTASGHAQRFFPNNGVSPSQFLALTPALIVLVLCNGLREELWFRGLFLNKYGKFLSPLSSNILSAIIFTSFHVRVQYTPALLPFLAIALVLGLFFGFLMQKSGSVLASVIFHAGSDIPIFLVYLSYALG
jgi:membrane protease YdiL (CAAX protease family)